MDLTFPRHVEYAVARALSQRNWRPFEGRERPDVGGRAVGVGGGDVLDLTPRKVGEEVGAVVCLEREALHRGGAIDEAADHGASAAAVSVGKRRRGVDTVVALAVRGADPAGAFAVRPPEIMAGLSDADHRLPGGAVVVAANVSDPKLAVGGVVAHSERVAKPECPVVRAITVGASPAEPVDLAI